MTWWHIPAAITALSIALAIFWPAVDDGYGWNGTLKAFLALLASLIAFIIGGALK